MSARSEPRGARRGAAAGKAAPGKTAAGRAASVTAAPGAAARGKSAPGATERETAIQRCVKAELQRYFELLDGEPPNDLYRMVMQQVERSLLDTVLQQCGGNRSQAAVWLGISRGTLRGKLAGSDRG